MPRSALSVSRLMIGTAALAVGLATLLPLRPHMVRDDPGVAALAAVMALVLAAGADRAAFGRGHRSFWIGFTAAGWLCAATSLVQLRAVRDVILKHGPPIVRAREAFILERIAAQRAQLLGVEMAMPEVSEWRLLMSLAAESGLGLALGVLVRLRGRPPRGVGDDGRAEAYSADAAIEPRLTSLYSGPGPPRRFPV